MKKLILLGIVFFTFLSFNKPVVAQVDLYLDQLNVYVSDYGRVSLYSLPDTIRQVYRTSLLVATGQDTVFDLNQDVDIEEPTTLLDNPTFGDYEIYGSYNNNYSGAPPNVLEKENIYCWHDLNSIIIKYTVINRESKPIDAINGWEFLPRIENNRAGGDTVNYSSQSKVITIRHDKAVGFKALSENLKSLGAFYYYTDYETDSLFYYWLSYNSIDSLFITEPDSPYVDAPALIPALNPKTIAPGDSVVFYITIAYGESETAVLASIEQAQQKYDEMITSVESDLNDIPSGFVLRQNYPNPFNPSTVISFNLPDQQFVKLAVYNSIGQEVKVLLNGVTTSGYHEVVFNAGNLPSGIYFYKLFANQYSSTKKMVLVK